MHPTRYIASALAGLAALAAIAGMTGAAPLPATRNGGQQVQWGRLGTFALGGASPTPSPTPPASPPPTASPSPACSPYWSFVQSPSPTGDALFYGIAATPQGDLWSVGYTRGGTATTTLIERWDGTAWQV